MCFSTDEAIDNELVRCGVRNAVRAIEAVARKHPSIDFAFFQGSEKRGRDLVGTGRIRVILLDRESFGEDLSLDLTTPQISMRRQVAAAAKRLLANRRRDHARERASQRRQSVSVSRNVQPQPASTMDAVTN